MHFCSVMAIKHFKWRGKSNFCTHLWSLAYSILLLIPPSTPFSLILQYPTLILLNFFKKLRLLLQTAMPRVEQTSTLCCHEPQWHKGKARRRLYLVMPQMLKFMAATECSIKLGHLIAAHFYFLMVEEFRAAWSCLHSPASPVEGLCGLEGPGTVHHKNFWAGLAPSVLADCGSSTPLPLCLQTQGNPLQRDFPMFICKQEDWVGVPHSVLAASMQGKPLQKESPMLMSVSRQEPV